MKKKSVQALDMVQVRVKIVNDHQITFFTIGNEGNLAISSLKGNDGKPYLAISTAIDPDNIQATIGKEVVVFPRFMAKIIRDLLITFLATGTIDLDNNSLTALVNRNVAGDSDVLRVFETTPATKDENNN